MDKHKLQHLLEQFEKLADKLSYALVEGSQFIVLIKPGIYELRYDPPEDKHFHVDLDAEDRVETLHPDVAAKDEVGDIFLSSGDFILVDVDDVSPKGTYAECWSCGAKVFIPMSLSDKELIFCPISECKQPIYNPLFKNN